MTDREMDEFALLWRQEAEPEDVQVVQQLARRASLRGHLLQHVDKGIAIAVLGGIAVLVLRDGSGAVALSGLLLLLGVSWSTWKRHTLWDAEAALGSSNREILLANAARTTRLRLKRVNVSLAVVVPIFLMGILFGYRLEGLRDGVIAASVGAVLANPGWYLAWAGIIFALMIHLFAVRERLRRELEHIAELSGEYHEAARLDAPHKG